MKLCDISTEIKTQIKDKFEDGDSISQLAKEFRLGWFTIKRIAQPEYEQQFKKVQDRYRLKPDVVRRYKIRQHNYQKQPLIKERVSNRFKERYHNEPEFKLSRREHFKKWYKESGRDYYNQYCKTPKGLAQARKDARIRRARKKQVLEAYSKVDEQFTRTLFNNVCAICGSNKDLTIDHWKPLSLGNPLTRNNAVLLCRSCNSKKGSKSPEFVFESTDVERINKSFPTTQLPQGMEAAITSKPPKFYGI